VDFGFILKFFLCAIVGEDPACSSLAYEITSELWLGYTHVGTGRGLGFVLKFFVCTIVGEDPACSSPCSRENE
jgi:hypothetical protein